MHKDQIKKKVQGQKKKKKNSEKYEIVAATMIYIHKLVFVNSWIILIISTVLIFLNYTTKLYEFFLLKFNMVQTAF
jgi:hypothetical protein